MRYEVMQLSDGWSGTDVTVAKATQLVRDSLTDPVVRLTAENLVRNLPERDKDAEIEAVSRFVRNNIRYTNEGIETLKTPRLLLDEIRERGKAVGDCDDHVILWLALHKTLGNRVRIRVVSQRQDRNASHIHGEVWSKSRGWISDDTIKKDQPLGWRPSKGITEEKIYEEGMGEFSMPHYQFMSENGTWHPGGCSRKFFNPRQRPGISQDQLTVGRNLLPSAYQIRQSSELGAVDLNAFGSSLLASSSGSAASGGSGNIISSIIGAGSAIAAGAANAIAAQKAQKAAEAQAKAATRVAEAQARAAQAQRDAAEFSSRQGGGISSFLSQYTTPLLIGGFAIAGIMMFMSMRGK